MLCSDLASEAEAIQGSGNLGSLRNKNGTSLYITNTKLCLVEMGYSLLTPYKTANFP